LSLRSACFLRRRLPLRCRRRVFGLHRHRLKLLRPAIRLAGLPLRRPPLSRTGGWFPPLRLRLIQFLLAFDSRRRSLFLPCHLHSPWPFPTPSRPSHCHIPAPPARSQNPAPRFAVFDFDSAATFGRRHRSRLRFGCRSGSCRGFYLNRGLHLGLRHG
jgi:hypothetical protein